MNELVDIKDALKTLDQMIAAVTNEFAEIKLLDTDLTHQTKELVKCADILDVSYFYPNVVSS